MCETFIVHVNMVLLSVLLSRGLIKTLKLILRILINVWCKKESYWIMVFIYTQNGILKASFKLYKWVTLTTELHRKYCMWLLYSCRTLNSNTKIRFTVLKQQN